MKSFYEVNELDDVTIDLSFVLPTFLGLGDKMMKTAVVVIDCYLNKDDDKTLEGTITREIAVANGDAGSTKDLSIVGTDFKTSSGLFSPAKSMIKDGGKFIIKIYSNKISDDTLLATQEQKIDLKNLAVAEAAPTGNFDGVNLEAGEASDESAKVMVKIPCNKMYDQDFYKKREDIEYKKMIFVNHTDLGNRYHIMFLGTHVNPDKPVSTVGLGTYYEVAGGNKATVTLFKVGENEYIIRVGEYDTETLDMDHNIMTADRHKDESGNITSIDNYVTPFKIVLSMGYDYTFEITPSC